MKITMYELLGMVKDGKIPKKIIFNGYEYLYHDKEHGYCRSDYGCTYICLNSEYYLIDILNDEVEIIEEKEICHKCHKYPAEYNQTYCEFCLGISKLEEEKKIPEKLEDISEIKCVGCKVEINIAGDKTLFDTDTSIVIEHCIYKINQLIKNQMKIINYLKSKGE